MILDSVPVDRVHAPRTTTELSEAIRSETGAMAPVGAGTELEFGNPLGPIDCAIDMRRLSRITEYVPADLTVHVEAGVTLGQLQTALAEHNQILPLDPWNGPEATIGGIAATNAQGPFRTIGGIRDWIIGMRVVEVDGRNSKTGGRVVKNVSGYDLAKLYTGSLGSLAIISEVSFKLRANFERTATVRARMDRVDDASRLVMAIRTGPFEPVSFLWTGPDNSIYVRFGEQKRAVDWQLSRLPAAEWETFEGEAERTLWKGVRRGYQELGDIVLRLVTLPSNIREVVERFKPNRWLAHAANGIVLLALPSPDGIAELRREFPVVIERAPIEVRRQVSAFGLDGREYELMKQLKRSFDPEGRLNPRRHVDGEDRV